MELGTSFSKVAEVRARYSDLVKVLGEPSYVRKGSYSRPALEDGDGKVSVEWGYDDEKYKEWGFIVNDWKEEETPMGLHFWDIRGPNGDKQAMYKFERMTGLRNHTFPFMWRREDVKEVKTDE